MKKALLCTDGSAYSQVSYEYAVWLAQRMEIEIEILYVSDRTDEQTVQTPDYSGNIGIDSYQQLLQQLVKVEGERAKINHQRAKIILREAKRFFNDRGIAKVKTTHETGFLVDLLQEQEKDSELIILGKRGETANFATEHLGSNLERIVRSSRKPCLVTPREFQPIERLLLAYDGGKSCQKAVQYLVDLAAFKNLELHVISVAEHGEDKAAKQLKTAEQTLKTGGFSPICQVLSGHAEPVMEKYIEEYHIDFLLMGAYGHSRIRHLVIGSTTTQMLRSVHIPVMLFR